MLASGLIVSACANSGLHSRAIPRVPSTTAPGTYPSLHVSGEGASSLPARPASTSEGPASGQQDVVFTDHGTGFLVTSSSVVGSLPASTGRIQRTADGGASWVTVWQEPGASLYWVGTAGSEVVASGTMTPTSSDDSTSQSPLLLVSGDDGTSWVSITPTIASEPSGPRTASVDWASFRLRFVTTSVGFAFPDADQGQDIFDAQLLRTTDGGRHWVSLDLTGGTPDGGLAFINPQDGFATGTTAKCQGQIWSTRDSGLSWQPIPGTCVAYTLDALSFPNSEDGFAAGGNFYKDGFYPQLAVLATSDGGRHWTTRDAQGGNTEGGGTGEGPFAQLQFVTPNVGYALGGGCVMGENGPCGGALWSTADGGRTWTQRSVSGLNLANDGPENLWLVDAGARGGGDVMWHSTDGAATWTPVADLANVAISGLAASGDSVWIATEAGQFISTDKGRSWASLPSAARQAEQRYGTVLAVGPSRLLVIGGESDQLWVSHDGGISGQIDSVPVHYEPGTIAFASDRQALAVGLGLGCENNTPVVVTTDGGSTWDRVNPLTVAGPGRVAYGSNLAVVTGLVGSGCSNAVATSTDAGQRWTTWSLPSSVSCSSASAGGDTAVLLCLDKTSTTAPETILVTRDSGIDWYGYTLQTSTAPGSVVASGSGELWAMGPPGLLWHSADGGAHWAALTPNLSVAT